MSETAKAPGTGVRVLTAAALLPVVVGTVWWGPTWLVAGVVFAVTALALWEFFALGERQALHGYREWTILSSAGLAWSQWTYSRSQSFDLPGNISVVSGEGQRPPEIVLLAFVLGLAALAVSGRRGLAEALPSAGISAAALLLVALPMSYAVRLHGHGAEGPKWLLFALAVVWVGDTAAYFTGRSIGRLKLAPAISPNKTWEGAAGNVIGALLVAAVFSRWLPMEVGRLVVVAALASVAGQIGDLAESAFKRGAGVKDSGALLPGHGGMLDRIDALIFALPVVWIALHLMGE